MKYWMEQSGIEFPQEGDEFHRVAAIYYMSNMGTLKDGKLGFIDKKGKLQIPFSYESQIEGDYKKG